MTCAPSERMTGWLAGDGAGLAAPAKEYGFRRPGRRLSDLPGFAGCWIVSA